MDPRWLNRRDPTAEVHGRLCEEAPHEVGERLGALNVRSKHHHAWVAGLRMGSESTVGGDDDSARRRRGCGYRLVVSSQEGLVCHSVDIGVRREDLAQGRTQLLVQLEGSHPAPTGPRPRAAATRRRGPPGWLPPATTGMPRGSASRPYLPRGSPARATPRCGFLRRAARRKGCPGSRRFGRR